MQPLCRRECGKFFAQRIEDAVQTNRHGIDGQPPRFKLGDIEQRRKDAFHLIERVLRLCHRLGRDRRQRLGGNRAHEELRRRQGLQKVMARSSHKTCAAGIGALGICQGIGKLQRPLHHPRLERFIHRRKLRQSISFGRDVGERDHETAVRHLFGVGLQDQGAALQLEMQLGPTWAGPGPFGKLHRARDIPKGDLALQPLQQRRDPYAHTKPRQRNGQQIAQPFVPAHKPLPGIKDADALGDVIKRRTDDTGLIVKHPPALFPLQPDDVGHVGLDDHRPAIRGPVL